MRTFPLLFLAAAIALPAASSAQRSHRSRDRERDEVTDTASWQWHGAVAAGKTLTISNVNGDIEVHPARGGEAIVHAHKEARGRAQVSDVSIHVAQGPDGVRICAVFPWQDASENECPSSSRRHWDHGDDEGNVSVEMVVEVPAGVDFVGQTVNGSIDADSLPGNADVATTNGSITLSARGHGTASTTNGSIHALIGKADWRDGAEFTTTNGDVVLTLPSDLNADVEAQTTNGEVDSAFPLTVQGSFRRGRLRGKIGTGGVALRLETTNGDIKIRKQ